MPTHLFPVTIQVGDVMYSPARFYGTPELAEVWVLGPDGKPVVAVSAPGFVKQARGMGHKFTDGRRAIHVLQVADGGEWLSAPTGGCGCSHPLKRFDPSKAHA